jgi:DNA adenine methylase
MTTNKSPLRYPGGKTRACKVLDEVVSRHFDLSRFNSVVSPFFGGGSFEFYLQRKYGFRLVVNDKFTPLYSFWKQVKTDKAVLCDELRKTIPITKERFAEHRRTIMGLGGDTLQQAIQYFILNRCSFSGSTLSGGFSQEASNGRFTPSSIDRIAALDFADIEIHNADFLEFVESALVAEPDSLVFLDPPYFLEKKSKLYGNNGDMHESFNHESLYGMLRTKKNWVLTYNNCEFIRNMYRDFTVIDVNWSYGMNKSKESSEIIIVSN